ncbi:hypothetical protein L3X38_012056 [Prunus dulcis]|uniref:Uncharacterized protein n=1 Tax=Prunus dulcis TaxID=3755 RepID=A0AAD4WK80_PRUDU|nr:hypothetical protein L3X38_012056 [Prunus dulcis]
MGMPIPSPPHTRRGFFKFGDPRTRYPFRPEISPRFDQAIYALPVSVAVRGPLVGPSLSHIIILMSSRARRYARTWF